MALLLVAVIVLLFSVLYWAVASEYSAEEGREVDKWSPVKYLRDSNEDDDILTIVGTVDGNIHAIDSR